MVDDPVAALERELVAAARRRRDAALAAIARRSSRMLGSALVFAVSAGVVTAIGAAIVPAGPLTIGGSARGVALPAAAR